jgi:hypothetical protein
MSSVLGLKARPKKAEATTRQWLTVLRASDLVTLLPSAPAHLRQAARPRRRRRTRRG